MAEVAAVAAFRRFALLGLPFAALACAAPAARAQQQRRAEWRIDLGAGTSQTLGSDLHIVQESTGTDAVFHDVKWKGHPFQGSRYYEVRVVAYPARQPKTGFFLDFTHYKVYALTDQNRRVTGAWLGEPVNENAPMDERVQYFRISNGVNVITEGVLFRQELLRSERFPSGRLQPYYGGGISQYVEFGINTVNGESNAPQRYQWAGWGFSLNGGVRYNFVPHFAGYVEGRYTSGDGRVKIADGGYGQTPLHTFHLAFGLSTDF